MSKRFTQLLTAAFAACAVLVAQPGLAAVFIDNTPTGDTIRGEGSGVGYYVDSGESDRIGEGGSSSTRRITNTILGFDLPTLAAGEVVDSVTLEFEITDVQDAGQLGDLLVSLLDTAAPDVTDYNKTSTVSGTDEIVGTESSLGVKTLSLTGDALTLFKGFYGGDETPDQSEVFFRLNNTTSITLGGAAIDRYEIDAASDVPVATLTVNAVPEPASLAMGLLGLTVLAARRRRSSAKSDGRR